RGELGISDKPFAPEIKTRQIPGRGEVWVEPRLLTALNLKVNDTVTIGAQIFRVTALVTTEPGRGGDLFNIAPSVLLNYDDLEATQLIQEGSRVRYSMLLAGEADAINTFRQFVKGKHDLSINMQGIRDARPEIRVALSRAEQFLGLAALTSVMLAGIAIALAAKRFAQRHLDHCAILRCIGATQAFILQNYLLQILFIGLIACLVGGVAGFFAHQILIDMLGSLVGVNLPAPGIKPMFFALATGMITLTGFALPPVVALKNVPALRVIKRDLGSVDVSRVLTYSLGILALSIIMIFQAGDIKLGIYMVLGTLLAVLVLIAMAYVLVWLIRHIPARSHSAWYIGLRALSRRSSSSVLQMLAFGLGIMALLILTVIRGDLLDEWQASIPADAPNRFVINISPTEVATMQQFFTQHGEAIPNMYPMVRGRIVAINDREVTKDSFTEQRARQMLSRELNLSWAAEMDEKNQLLEGQWWDKADYGKPLISIEQSVAKNLSVKLGDKLKFKVADQYFEASVASIREVDWGSFNANFYVLAPPGLLEKFPATYMSPFYLSPEKFDFLNELVARFSNVTVIDVAAIMAHVRTIINRVTLAVEYVFLFTLLAGLMVLFAGVQSTLDERMVENAIMKTLGGKKNQLYQALWSEYLLLGALAGLVAALLATMVSFAIAHFVLKIPMHWNFGIWWYGLVGGALGVSIFGVAGSLTAIRQPPIMVLKKISLTN
ncbi:MAG: FtsX-like permease family protein, partial [Gammaproteobacteria bacterium]|nr:FtsX-like permease family protein [Gammaproteobacteria bacterium]